MDRVGLFSLESDLHVHAIARELKNRHVQCHIFATDSQIETGGISWSNTSLPPVIRDYSGQWIDIRDLSTIWWRRVNQPQRDEDRFCDKETYTFVSNEWKGAIFGIINDSFSGVWVNDPKFDALAGNKLYHLKKAEQVGLKTPNTLISSDAATILKFIKQQKNGVVIKKILGTPTLPLATVQVPENQLNESLSNAAVCPSIYQEKIQSKRHIRAHCFGDEVYSVLIESDDLDWRRNLNCKFTQFSLGSATDKMLAQLLRLLKLKMGIMDLMISDSDDLVWLEINPQGQFLFAEALSGLDLKARFANFLCSTLSDSTA